MLLQYIILAATLAVAAPHPEGEITNIKRGGNRQAVLRDGTDCSGDNVGQKNNFGCDGTCYRSSGPAFSIALQQDTTSGKKPTTDIFSDYNCQNKITHAGIHNGQHSGCTNINGEGRSYRVYYGC